MTIGRPALVMPRFGTKRDESRETFGPQVAQVARRLGLEPMPHQQLVWDVALEYDSDGRFVYDEVDLSTMRQTSKTTTMFCKKVWRLTMGSRMWGPQRSTYTMQLRAKARAKLEKDFAEVLLRSPTAKRSFREIVNAKARPVKASDWKLSLNNGSEHIMFGRGNYLQIDAPSAIGGHGDVLDDGDIDEAFAHQDDAIEQGMKPSMATRWNRQLWVGSTAGDERSFYWYDKVLAGRRQIESGAMSRTAYFEWSIPDEADIDDEDVWWAHMPALGHTIPPEFIRAELESARRRVTEGGEDLWRRGYGNQWPHPPVLTAEMRPSKLPPECWRSTAILAKDAARIADSAFAVDVTVDGSFGSVSSAGGSMQYPYIECFEHRQGTGWVPSRLVDLAKKNLKARFGINGAGPAGALVGPILLAFADAGIRADRLVQLNAVEYRQACGNLFLSCVEGRLRHSIDGQGPLDLAASDATERTVGDAFAWEVRQATVPISPLTSSTIAAALLPHEPTKSPIKARVHSF